MEFIILVETSMLIIIILYMYIISLSKIYSEGYRRSFKNTIGMTNIWIHPSIRIIALEVMNFMILVDHSLVILSMPDLCSGVEEGTFREIMHFHYLTNMTRPYHKHHEVMKFTTVVVHFLVIITIYPVCQIYAQE